MTIQLDEGIVFPRDAVRFPIELRMPAGMRLQDPDTWPRVEGRLEFVGGRLLYMPPCADVQQDVAIDVAYVLRSWSRTHTEFIVGGNEAGMLLDGEIRGADAAVWRRADAERRTGKFRSVAPVLAVEIAGQDEAEEDLRVKARWYLEHGVAVVWIILPVKLEVVVLQRGGESRVGIGARLPECDALPGLTPAVEELFAQLRS